MSKPSSTTAARVVFGLRQLAQALKAQSWRTADEAGLSPTQREILTQIEAGDGPRRLAELAASLSITSATASDAVRALEAKGLVRKNRAPADGRALALAATAAGRRRARALAEWPAFLTDLVAALDTGEQVVLLRALVKIIKGLQEQHRIPEARMCVTCQFFHPYRHGGDPAPHHCAWVDAAFGDGDLRLTCHDFQPADDATTEANWRRFVNVS